jgi:hypothetical protein
VDKAAMLDWILAGNSSSDDRSSSSSSSSSSSDYDVYAMCLQGRFQEKPMSEDAIDISSPDGEVAAQLLALLGPQFTITAKVVGVSSTCSHP